MKPRLLIDRIRPFRVQLVLLPQSVCLARPGRAIEDEIDGAVCLYRRRTFTWLRILLRPIVVLILLPELPESRIVEIDRLAGILEFEFPAQTLQFLVVALIAPVVDLIRRSNVEGLENAPTVVIRRHALHAVRE